ncbi:MAG: 5'-nucleotidase C-terminal domain-containing protein [Deltaproteobacteria bacterium]|nr:5'-nucleotidase C-terminal domain-containing protein [Deltaproteobacteria bacterium]
MVAFLATLAFATSVHAQPEPEAPEEQADAPELADDHGASEAAASESLDSDGAAASGTSRPSELDVLGAIVASAGIAGELVTPVCNGETTLRPMEAAMALESLYRRRAEGALVIDTGGILARHGVMRFAARENPEALAQLATRMGFHALAFGETDLGDPRPLLLARLRALKAAGIPVLATNLTCDAEHAELCELLVTAENGLPTHVIRDADGEETKVAVLSFLEPETMARVGPDRAQGLTLRPLKESIRLAVTAARARGAETVVAIIDSGRGASAAARALSAVAGLESEEKPDLILSSDAGSELLFARPASFRPALVAPPPRGASDVRLRRNRIHDTYDVLARPIVAGEAASAAIPELVEALGAGFCEELGELMPGGRFSMVDEESGDSVPMDDEGLVRLTAGVMRQVANADVAILNHYAIDNRWRPANSEGLTGADIQIGIQYDEPIMVAEVTAFWMKQFARSNPSERDLMALGLEITNPYGSLEKVKVNGRVLDETARYRIVSVRFLAEGGDGDVLGGASDLEWEPLEGVTLRSAMTEFLEEPHEEDPREAVVDPWEILEWTGRINVDATFTGSAVRDSSQYGEGPLTNSPQVLFGLNSQLALNALSRYASWENLVTATYSMARTTESAGFDEGSDLLTYRSAGLYRRFRAEKDELYVPDLLVEGLVRTEFSRSDERDHRFMNLRFVGGLQWRLHLKVQARLVGGLEVIEVADPDLRSAQPGFGAQLNIGPWQAMKSGTKKLTLTANLDYFATNPGGRNRHLIQALFDMQLNLTAAFALTLNVSFYGLRDQIMATDTMPAQDGAFAFSLQTTAGFRVAWTERWLSY